MLPNLPKNLRGAIADHRLADNVFQQASAIPYHRSELGHREPIVIDVLPAVQRHFVAQFVEPAHEMWKLPQPSEYLNLFRLLILELPLTTSSGKAWWPKFGLLVS